MSAGPLIASGIGIFLLVVTAYILIGGTLTTTEVMVEAQSNLAANQEARMRTAIAIQNATLDGTTLSVEVKNTGSEPVVDIRSIDLYILTESVPVYIPSRNWDEARIVDPDEVHPGQFDPGEILQISLTCAGDAAPTWVQVVTPNGVSSSAYITTGG